MKKELTREVVEQLITWLDTAGSFVLEQAPLVAQEIIRYAHFKAVMGIWIGVVLAVVGLICLILTIVFEEPFPLFITVPCWLISPAFLLVNYLTLKQIVLAPKLFLLKELKYLL